MSFMNKKCCQKEMQHGFQRCFPKMDPRNIEMDKNAVVD